MFLINFSSHQCLHRWRPRLRRTCSRRSHRLSTDRAVTRRSSALLRRNPPSIHPQRRGFVEQRFNSLGDDCGSRLRDRNEIARGIREDLLWNFAAVFVAWWQREQGWNEYSDNKQWRWSRGTIGDHRVAASVRGSAEKVQRRRATEWEVSAAAVSIEWNFLRVESRGDSCDLDEESPASQR